VHELHEQGEGGDIEEELQSGGQPEAQELEEDVTVPAQSGEGAVVVAEGLREVGGREDADADHAGRDGADGGAAQAEGREAPRAQNQDVVEEDVHRHADAVGQHDDAGAANAGEEAAEGGAQEREDGEEDEDAVVLGLEGALHRLVARAAHEPEPGRADQQDHRVAEHRQEDALGRRQAAGLTLAAAEVLRHQGIAIADDANEEGEAHEGGDAAAESRGHVLLADARQEEPAGEHHESVGRLADEHRHGDRQDLAHTAVAIEMRPQAL